MPTVTLNWQDNGVDETAYAVERSLNGTDWSVLDDTLPADTTQYVDSNQPAGQTNYYRVRCQNATGWSEYSGVLQVDIPGEPLADMDLDFRLNWGEPVDNAIIAGPSSFTFSRADTVAMGWDQSGILRRSGTENLCQGSEEFTAPNWNTSNVTRTADDAVAPDGNTTADHLNETNASALGNVNFITTVSDDSTAWCFSVYVKADDSTDISLRVRIAGGTAVDGSVYYDVSDWSTTTSGAVTNQGSEDAGNGWRRIWVTVTNNSTGNTSLSYYIYPARATEFDTASVGAIWAWGAQLENAATPGIYVPTTNSPVLAGQARFDHDPADQLISGLYRPLGVLMEDAATNEILQSEDFGTTWTNTTIVTTNDAIAPDGTMTADKIDDNSASNLRTHQTITTPSDTTSWTFSVFIKKTTSDSHSCGVQMQYASSTPVGDAYINTNTGATSLGATNAADDHGVIDCGDYWRFWLTLANASRTTLQIKIFPATDANDQNASLTGFKHYWGAQLENTAYPTSYISTTTASVTRADERLYTTDVSWLDYVNKPISIFWQEDTYDTEDASNYSFSFSDGVSQYIYNRTRLLDRPRFEYISQGTNLRLDTGGLPSPQSRALSINELDTKSSSWGATTESAAAPNLRDSDIITTFDVGANPGGGALQGHIPVMQVWNEAKTQEELNTITSAISSPSLHLDFAQNWGSTLESCTTVGPQNLLTYSRADTVATGYDENGVLRTSGVTNYCLYSQDLLGAAWVTGAGSPEPTTNVAIAPDGTLTADSLTDDNAGAYEWIRQNIDSLTSGQPYTFSCYVKKNADETFFPGFRIDSPVGAAKGRMHFNTNTGAVNEHGGTPFDAYGSIDAGDYWRIWMTFTTGDTVAQVQFYPAISDSWGSATPGGEGTAIYWGAQCEPGTEVRTYVKTDGAIVSTGQPVFDHVYNGSAWEPAGLVVEEARTNIVLHSETPGDVNWTRWNTTVVSTNNLAPDGVSDAYEIQDAAGSALGRARMTATVAADTSNWCVSAFFAKDSTPAATRSVGFQFDFTGTTYGVLLDTSTGEVGKVVGKEPTEVGVIDAGAFWRLWASGPNTSQTGFLVDLWPAGGTSLTANDNAAQGTAIIWGVMAENAASPSSYIATTTSSVTRAKVVCNSDDDLSGWNNRDLTGTYFCEARAGANFDTGMNNQYLFGGGRSTARPRIYMYLNSSTGSNTDLAIGAYSGGDTGSAKGPTPTNNTNFKVAFAFAEDDLEFYQDGIQEGIDNTADISRPEDNNKFRLNVGSDRVTGQNQMNGHIKDFRYWRQRLPAAELQTLTE